MVDIKDHPLGTSEGSSITIERRKSLSTRSNIVQKGVKTFSTMIMKPGKDFPVGSPQLTPHKSAYKGCSIDEYQLEGCYLYGFTKTTVPKDPNGHVVKHKLYYFAGGGFRGAPTKEHWLLCAELCAKLPQYSISLVSYPLAPNNPAHESIPRLQKMCDKLAEQSRTEGFRITFMGDSAGGNIALVLGLHGAAEFLKNSGGDVCPVEDIFVLSPAVDHRNTNPEIDKVDPQDPILSRKVIEEVSQCWKGEWSVEDPRVSPTLADLSILKRANVKVDGVLGMDDVLTPDAIVFREKLEEAGVVGQWLDWEQQMHVFPILFSYHVPEAVEGMKWILDVLDRNASR